MKYLIEWILKMVIFFTIGAMACVALQLLALFFWDKKFMDIAVSIVEYFWIKKQDNGTK